MNQKGIGSTVVIAIIVIVVVAVGVGSYFFLKGIGGGVLGALPVYAGAQETNDTMAQQAITGLITGMGSPSSWAGKAYTTTADPQTVINWYRTQMSGWTKTVDNTMQQGDMTIYVLDYTKGNDGAVILTFSAVGYGNYLILLAGPKPTPSGGENQPGGVPPSGTYSGGPICIQSDDQFTRANGVVSGSGTRANPYIIEGWTIDASSAGGTTNAGVITISGTTKYFIIRNCSVTNGGEVAYYGIELDHVVNGEIENNTCSGNTEGIYLYFSSNNTISNNTCSNNSNGGILLDSSCDNNTLTGNTCLGNSDDGIRLNYTVGTCSSNTLTGNTCSGNSFCGIYLSDCDGNTISNNTCSNNSHSGIKVGSNNTLTGNTCLGNLGNVPDESGIWGYDYNTLTSNTCSGNSPYDIYLESYHNTLSGNTYGTIHLPT